MTELDFLPRREAARQGADLIECDMALTKDRALICSHAPYLRFSNQSIEPLFQSTKLKTLGYSLQILQILNPKVIIYIQPYHLF